MQFAKPKLIKGNGYEAQRTSLFHVFVFGLDRAQNTIGFEVTNRNVSVL